MLLDADIFSTPGCAWALHVFPSDVCVQVNDKRSVETCALLLLCANGTLGLSFFFYSPPPRSLTSFISVIPHKQDVGYTHVDKWRKGEKNQSVAIHLQALQKCI